MSSKRRIPVRVEAAPEWENRLSTRPTQDEIRQRAYENYIARGDGPGDALTDWIEAECELCEKCSTPVVAASTAAAAVPIRDDQGATRHFAARRV